jgi:C1A family cysteine protease
MNQHPLVKQWISRKIPKSLDWRDHGVVNNIRDQGRCGSCWAFAAIGVIESSFARKYGKLLKLSE